MAAAGASSERFSVPESLEDDDDDKNNGSGTGQSAQAESGEVLCRFPLPRLTEANLRLWVERSENDDNDGGGSGQSSMFQSSMFVRQWLTFTTGECKPPWHFGSFGCFMRDLALMSDWNVAGHCELYKVTDDIAVPWWVMHPTDLKEEDVRSDYTELCEFEHPRDAPFTLYERWVKLVMALSSAVDPSFNTRAMLGDQPSKQLSQAELALYVHQEVVKRGLLHRLRLLQRLFQAQVVDLSWNESFVACLESLSPLQPGLTPDAAWLTCDLKRLSWGSVVNGGEAGLGLLEVVQGVYPFAVLFRELLHSVPGRPPWSRVCHACVLAVALHHRLVLPTL